MREQGTPHRGSNLAKLGKVMASIVATCSPLKASQTILASIRKDYELLLEVAEDFVWRRKSMHVITFFETEMTHVTPFYKCVARVSFAEDLATQANMFRLWTSDPQCSTYLMKK